MHSISRDEYLASCLAIAREAGALIMTYFRGEFNTAHKQDQSPVTNADIEANGLITRALTQAFPSVPIIAEEDDELGRRDHERFWLVDPLDGTRSFVRGEPEFTVNIGLIERGMPVLGVIYAPPQDMLYYGIVGQGAFRQAGEAAAIAIKTRLPSPEGLVVVRSKSHPSPRTQAYLETLKVKELISESSSVKFCRLADGSGDIYPRLGRTMEWDTAAGHAILAAAGGRVETPEGKPLAYGKPGFENPHFIAYGR